MKSLSHAIVYEEQNSVFAFCLREGEGTGLAFLGPHKTQRAHDSSSRSCLSLVQEQTQEVLEEAKS